MFTNKLISLKISCQKFAQFEPGKAPNTVVNIFFNDGQTLPCNNLK